MWCVKGSYTNVFTYCIFIFCGFYIFHHILNSVFVPKSTTILLPCPNQTTTAEPEALLPSNNSDQQANELDSKIILAPNSNESFRNRIMHGFPDALCLTNDTLKCLPAFIHFYPILKSANKYKISACVIPKSMSTIITSFMCLLHDEERHNITDLDFTKNIWENRLCGDTNEYGLIENTLNDGNATIDEWELFSVVRDPMERLLSAFLHLCVRDKHNCFGCGSNLSCFLERAYYQAYGYADGKDISALHIHMHYFPQNWFCQFGEYFAKYKFIHHKSPLSPGYEKMVSQIIDVLSFRQNIPNSTITAIQDELLEKHLTLHATVKSPLKEKYENELKNNKTLLRYFIKLYYHDYVLFKFPMPEYFKDILNEIV